MPIEVELPDGSIAEFPDGTPNEVMRQAISKRFPPQAPARTTAQETGRQLGLGTRHLIEGAAQTAGILYDPIASVGNAILPGDPFMSGRALGQTTADTLGLPTPENPYEEFAGATTRAVTGGGGFLAGGRALANAPGVAGQVGKVMSASPGLQLTGAATGGASADVARQSGASPGWQVAAGIVGGLTPSVLATAPAAATRGVLRGSDATPLRENIAAFQAAGAMPTVAQATGRQGVQAVEQTLGRLPGGAGVIGRAREMQAEQLGRGVEQVASRLSPRVGSEQAGRSIERGVQAFMSERSRKATELYNRAGQLLPPNTRLPLTNTQQTLSDIVRLTPGAESTTAQLVNPKIQQIATAVGEDLMASQGQGLPYSAVKELRTRVGAELDNFSLSADRPTAELKKLYAALSRDLEAAAKGNPQAAQAMRRANDFYRASQNRIDLIERVVSKNGGPERVFSAALSGTKDGATTLRAVMQSLPKDAQRDVTAAVVRRLGRAKPGQQDDLSETFSPETFLTNWNTLSPEARRVLFDRFGPTFSSDMSKVAKAMSAVRDSARVGANPSGTAGAAANQAALGGMVVAALTGQPGVAGGIAGGMATANLSARLFTNPRFVSWLAKNTDKPISSINAQAVILSGLGQKYDEPELTEFADLLKQTQQPPQEQAESY
jgi:hypothetical protein